MTAPHCATTTMAHQPAPASLRFAGLLRDELADLERERVVLSLAARLRLTEWEEAEAALRAHDAAIEAAESLLDEIEREQEEVRRA